MMIEDDILNFTRMFRKEKKRKRVKRPRRIIVSGMGGSGISGDIASMMCNTKNSPQVIAWKNYGLPNWTNSKDCVICIS